MFCWQQVRGLCPSWVFLIYPNLGVDMAKLSVESPKTQITWHTMPWTIRFDFTDVCTDGTMTSSSLAYRTFPVAAALPNYRITVKSYIFCCICIVVGCFLYCIYFSVVVWFFVLYLFPTALVVGSWTMMFVNFTTFVVGSWVLLCSHFGFLPFRLSESFPLFWFSMMFFYSSKKKKKNW